MALLEHISDTVLGTIFDVLPIAAILLFFQFLIIRERPTNLRQIGWGFLYVLMGLSLFLVGLEEALFPIGETMARQLTSPQFLYGGAAAPAAPHWRDFLWVYIFAAAIGFATTVAEPALIAVSVKANEVSGGALSAWGLRVAVAVGVAVGVSVGTFRIVTGTPLPLYIMAGYVVVMIQTLRAPRSIIPLAYDSGGVTTSTVTVPVVTALGLGLATAIPGRSPLIDGFGLIAFASVFPIMSVMGYTMAASWRRRRRIQRSADEELNP